MYRAFIVSAPYPLSELSGKKGSTGLMDVVRIDNNKPVDLSERGPVSFANFAKVLPTERLPTTTKLALLQLKPEPFAAKATQAKMMPESRRSLKPNGWALFKYRRLGAPFGEIGETAPASCSAPIFLGARESTLEKFRYGECQNQWVIKVSFSLGSNTFLKPQPKESQ